MCRKFTLRQESGSSHFFGGNWKYHAAYMEKVGALEDLKQHMGWMGGWEHHPPPGLYLSVLSFAIVSFPDGERKQG